MADSQRLRTTEAGLRLVSAVAARLAERGDETVSVLAVTTYFPVDVASVARVFEGLEELDGITRVERGPLTVHHIEDPEQLIVDDIDIEDEDFLAGETSFMKAVGALKRDADWSGRVRGQHQLLQIAAGADQREVELSYLTSRADMSRARVQSLLNDFDAQGYVGVEVDEEVDAISYEFPTLDYPSERFERNMQLLEEAEVPARSRVSAWVLLAVFAVMVLIAVILLRF